MSIYDIVKAKEIGVYYNTMQKDRPPYLGEVLFPLNKKMVFHLNHLIMI